MNRYLGITLGTILLLAGALAHATDATLLPNATQWFMDNNGRSLSNGKVYFYTPGTTTPKTTWTSAGKTTPQANPVQLGSSGRPTNPIYGDGAYRQIVKDQFNNTIWDFDTASTGNGSSGTSPAWSEGVMVGTIIPWAGQTLPPKYLYAAGQAISRTTYSDLYTALVISTPVLCNIGLSSISVSTDISDKIPIGAKIEASCFAPGTTVTAKSSGLLTMSTNATITVGTTALLFPWGNGDGATTFNVPDYRGRNVTGRNNMNTGSGPMDSDSFGTNPNALGAYGGAPNTTMTSGYLPPYVPSGRITYTPAQDPVYATGAGGSPFSGSGGAAYGTLPTTYSFTGNPYGGGIAVSATVFNAGSGYTNGTQTLTLTGGTCTIQPQFTVTVSAGVVSSPVLLTAGKCLNPPSNAASTTGGGGTGAQLNVTYSAIPLPRVVSTATADYIVKALADDLPTGPGVTSIQGMTGAIACAGTAITCSANTITVNLPSFASGVSSLGGMTGALACGSGITCSASTVSASRLNYIDYGIRCDGVTDDGPAFRTAFNALAGAPLYLPSGTCRIATTAFYNTTAPANVLTVPGVKIIGQGRGVTKIDTTVANGYALALNPDWAAGHSSMFVLTPLTTGVLATNTYYVQATITNPASTEVYVGTPKAVSVVGPTGSVQMTLQPLNSGYCYNLYIGTANPPVNYAKVSGSNAVCLAGNQTITIKDLGSAHAVPTTTRAIWQEAQLSNLSITNTTAAANASGVLWFRVAYSWMSNVYMKGLTGDGLAIPNWTGDVDGSFVVTVDQSKFDSISGWCINAAGNTLEFSNFTVSNSVFNICGTAPTNLNAPFTMTAITNANPGVVTTASAHTLTFGDQVYISGVAGMSLATGMYRACGTVSGSTFSLCDLNGANVNTTALGAYTASSGTERLEWRPPQMLATGVGGPGTAGGAIAYTGLISNWVNNGFTQNNNVDVYLSEAGANDNASFVSNDFENTAGKGLYAATVINLSWLNGECLTSASLGQTVSCMQFGTGLNKGGAQNVTINGMKVRSDSAIANGFEQLTGAAGTIYQNTFTVMNIYYQTWAGLNKYFGFKGDPNTKFWARLDGLTGATCTIKSSYNIASCVRNGVGDYTITFTTAMPDANYAFNGTGNKVGTAPAVVSANSVANIAAATLRFACYNSTTAALMDCDIMSIQGSSNP